jgi:hypothetical protein
MLADLVQFFQMLATNMPCLSTHLYSKSQSSLENSQSIATCSTHGFESGRARREVHAARSGPPLPVRTLHCQTADIVRMRHVSPDWKRYTTQLPSYCFIVYLTTLFQLVIMTGQTSKRQNNFDGMLSVLTTLFQIHSLHSVE